MYNYATGLKEFFNPVPKAISKEKFTISTYRVFKYTKNLDGVECSQSASSPFFTHFTMLKKNTKPNLTFMPKCYENALPIKHAKYQNVMLLAQGYVGKNDMHFYQSLKSDEITLAEVEAESDVTDQNSPSDCESD
jgi:hypothetical protein